MLVSPIIEVGVQAPWLPGWSLLLLPILLITSLSWGVATHGEPWLRARLRPLVGR